MEGNHWSIARVRVMECRTRLHTYAYAWIDRN